MKNWLIVIMFCFICLGCLQNNKKEELEDSSISDIRINQNTMKINLNNDEKKILQYLDSCVSYSGIIFMDLDHGYGYLSGSRLTLYKNTYSWAIVFEKTVYDNRRQEIVIELNFFGSDFKEGEALKKVGRVKSNVKYITLVDYITLNEISDGFELVDKSVDSIKVRGELLKIEHNPKLYKEKGIDIMDFDNPNKQIDFVALTRYLDEEYPDLFRASKEEKKSCIDSSLNEIMEIDEWYHKLYNGYLGYPLGTPPSQYETFQLISKVLVSGDSTLWQPTLKPNNHWKNWKNAGRM